MWSFDGQRLFVFTDECWSIVVGVVVGVASEEDTCTFVAWIRM